MIKLLVWIGLAVVIGLYIKPKWIYGVLAVGGVIESLIAFGQFLQQKSLGLYFFGEPVLSPLNPDVARIFIDADGWGRLLRAYGTFPHPNILGGFLVLSLLALYYLATKYESFTNIRKLLIAAAIFIVWLGLLLTFSRATWLVAALSTIFFYPVRYVRYSRHNVPLVAVSVLASVLVLVGIFSWAVWPRLAFTDSFIIQERISDYQRAWQLIKEKPFFGHGLTLAMGEQPIHNLYLTIAVEAGLVGLLVFLIFVIWNLFGAWNLEFGISKAMLIALLLLGLADHFLWTLRPGLAMLWLIIGLNLKNKLS